MMIKKMPKKIQSNYTFQNFKKGLSKVGNGIGIGLVVVAGVAYTVMVHLHMNPLVLMPELIEMLIYIMKV